jgi:hypothetical protein
MSRRGRAQRQRGFLLLPQNKNFPGISCRIIITRRVAPIIAQGVSRDGGRWCARSVCETGQPGTRQQS